MARDAAKVKVPDGFFKNGNPKFKTMYRCETCQELFEYEDTQMDHKSPVIDVLIGFVDWNTYIARLFTTQDNYACLCCCCHGVKTEFEKEIRADQRKLNKKLDTSKKL